MEIIKTYSDLVVIDNALQDQIDLTKHELYEWYGVDIDEGDRTFAGMGKSARKMSLPSAVEQAQDRLLYLSRLEARLSAVRLKRERLDDFISQLEGLDHKIAYRRLVEGKTHIEIAAELNYSYDYIRERWSKLDKTHNKPAIPIDN